MTLTPGERRVLALAGLVTLGGFSLCLWQHRPRDPLRLTGAVEPRQAGAWDRAMQRARSVDVNTAGVAELARLPQIGPALARRIIAHRQAHGPFRDAEGLLQVKGIGPETYAALEGHVTTGEKEERR